MLGAKPKGYNAPDDITMRPRARVFCRNPHTMMPRPVSLYVHHWTAAALAALALSGCANSGTEKFGTSVSTLGGIITPYKIDILQGNVVTREQAQALQPGMAREQVRGVLGTPLLASVFHADRWDYVFTFQRQGQPPQQRKLSVFFNGDTLTRIQADELPTEAEFVASLDKRRNDQPLPKLQASPEELEAFRAKNPARHADTTAATPAPTATFYPPLESR